MSKTIQPEPIQGLPMVGIHVTDTDRSIAFYQDVLGLNVVGDVPMEQLGGRMVILTVPGSQTVLSLFPGGDMALAYTGIRLSVTDAAAWHRYLQDAGATVSELLEWPGVPPMFEFEDPDRNGLVIVS
ncbi:VOC family protein [Demetria terragena]|uniref:VOC family protein n=1 Tax=Demetria terragena TaxID=63959 RepID=UPI0003743CC9|nr:VOC family protein [Demetria terragena]